MNNILAIAPQVKPNNDLVETLEDMLKDAKEGKIRSMVAVTDEVGTTLGKYRTLEKDCSVFSLIGVLEKAKLELITLTMKNNN